MLFAGLFSGRDTLAPTLTRLVNTLSQYVSPIPSEVSTKDGTSILITEPNVEDNTVVFNTKISGHFPNMKFTPINYLYSSLYLQKNV